MNFGTDVLYMGMDVFGWALTRVLCGLYTMPSARGHAGEGGPGVQACISLVKQGNGAAILSVAFVL